MGHAELSSPLSLFYSWQALLLAVVVSGLTQVVKAALEVYLRVRKRGITDLPGKTLRQMNPKIRVLMPLVPLLLGAVCAMVIPARPEVLVAYGAAQGNGSLGIYGLWGAAVGQFSDYLYQHLKRVLGALAPTVPVPGTPTPAEPPALDSTPDSAPAEHPPSEPPQVG